LGFREMHAGIHWMHKWAKPASPVIVRLDV
jgi:hypothetical protein